MKALEKNTKPQTGKKLPRKGKKWRGTEYEVD